MPTRTVRGPPSSRTRAETPAPGWAWKSSTSGRSSPRSAGLGDEQARQRVLARPLGGGGQAEQSSWLQPCDRRRVAQLGPALGQGAGLVEREGVDPRQPLQGRPPLTSTPRRASRAVAARTAAGVARIRAQGQATTSTARVGITSIGRAARPCGPRRQRPGALVRRKTSGGRRQHGGQEEPGVAVGRALQRRALAWASAIRRITWPSVVSVPTFSARTSSRPNWLNVPV